VLLSADAGHYIYLLSQQVPALAAFWTDLDPGNSASENNRLSYKVAGNQLIITYDRIPLKNGGGSDYLSFQVCLEFGDSLAYNSNILIQFDKEASGTNFITSYFNNTLQPHLIGMKNTYGNNFLLYRFRDSSDLVIKGPVINSSLALMFGPAAASLDNRCSQLDLTVLLQAISPRTDTMTVSLRDSKNGYKVLESRKVYPDSTGKSIIMMTIPDDHYKYYIVVNHKNSIETWSKLGGEVFSSYELSYDFTSDTAMALGNNLILKNGLANIYTGDINQDGAVNVNDVTDIFNGMNSFSTGYSHADLDNDERITLHDMLYCYNNNIKFVIVISP
ncbi:MAG: hypothetical protein ABI462_06650, partial [Ignavibacteria bacterium]